MKLALTLIALIVFALSFVADYKWRKWMAGRRSAQNTVDPPRNPHP